MFIYFAYNSYKVVGGGKRKTCIRQYPGILLYMWSMYMYMACTHIQYCKINFTSCRSHILCTNPRISIDNYWQLSSLRFLPLAILYRWVECGGMQVHSWIDVCLHYQKNFLHPLQGKLHIHPPIRNFPVQCQLKSHGGTTPTQRPVFANPSIPTQCIQWFWCAPRQGS